MNNAFDILHYTRTCTFYLRQTEMSNKEVA